LAAFPFVCDKYMFTAGPVTLTLTIYEHRSTSLCTRI